MFVNVQNDYVEIFYYETQIVQAIRQAKSLDDAVDFMVGYLRNVKLGIEQNILENCKKENEELKHDIGEYVRINTKLASENMELRKALSTQKVESNEKLCEVLDYMKKLLERLPPMGGGAYTCNFRCNYRPTGGYGGVPPTSGGGGGGRTSSSIEIEIGKAMLQKGEDK